MLGAYFQSVGVSWGVEHGKFLLIWQRQLSGDWKIVLDMGDSNGN